MNSDISPSPGDVVRRLLKELVPVALLLAAEDGLHTQLLHPLSTGERKFRFKKQHKHNLLGLVAQAYSNSGLQLKIVQTQS